MTQGGNEAAGDAAAAVMPASRSVAADSPAWAPMRQRAFRWLWLGVLISSIGTWMQTVGAQWLLVDAPNAAAFVSLVSVANTLPVMLLALPGESWPTPSIVDGYCSPSRPTSSSSASWSPCSLPPGRCRQPCCSPSPSPWAPASPCSCPDGRRPSPSWCPGHNLKRLVKYPALES